MIDKLSVGERGGVLIVDEIYHELVFDAAPCTALAGGDDLFVIEINDNPNLDAGVEDFCIQKELYNVIMGEFARRLDQRFQP